TNPDKTPENKFLTTALSSLRFPRRLVRAQYLFQSWIFRMAGFQCLLVMPACHFQRRRLSGGVNHSEVVMGIGMARRQFDRSTKRRLGRFAQPLFSQRDAEILERVGILRIELRGPAERVERFIVLLLPDFP